MKRISQENIEGILQIIESRVKPEHSIHPYLHESPLPELLGLSRLSLELGLAWSLPNGGFLTPIYLDFEKTHDGDEVHSLTFYGLLNPEFTSDPVKLGVRDIFSSYSPIKKLARSLQMDDRISEEMQSAGRMGLIGQSYSTFTSSYGVAEVSNPVVILPGVDQEIVHSWELDRRVSILNGKRTRFADVYDAVLGLNQTTDINY
jgi:hypothetical protein